MYYGRGPSQRDVSRRAKRANSTDDEPLEPAEPMPDDTMFPAHVSKRRRMPRRLWIPERPSNTASDLLISARIENSLPTRGGVERAGSRSYTLETQNPLQAATQAQNTNADEDDAQFAACDTEDDESYAAACDDSTEEGSNIERDTDEEHASIESFEDGALQNEDVESLLATELSQEEGLDDDVESLLATELSQEEGLDDDAESSLGDFVENEFGEMFDIAQGPGDFLTHQEPDTADDDIWDWVEGSVDGTEADDEESTGSSACSDREASESPTLLEYGNAASVEAELTYVLESWTGSQSGDFSTSDSGHSSLPADLDERRAMTQSQVEDLLARLRQVRQTRNGASFEAPVAQIWPQLAEAYAERIANPMDLNIIEAKLKDGLYACIFDFKADARLLHQNSVQFNGDCHPITKLALEVEQVLLEGLEK
ncbi:uncharacterized protein PAC_15224 [Phialocephala subalpina]|uniref:Bromo domain-containing protein n=1 Tax=Phialocephala subalpina TaxID=576137 RepID=A0A1L7XJZ4_9HELO|nr:uncharacterized protein PAC_15224 [Phialocephala subalpina]